MLVHVEHGVLFASLGVLHHDLDLGDDPGVVGVLGDDLVEGVALVEVAGVLARLRGEGAEVEAVHRVLEDIAFGGLLVELEMLNERLHDDFES